MNILDIFKTKNKDKEKRSIDADVNAIATALGFNTITSYSSTDYAMTLPAVYRCCDVISDAIASLPIDLLVDKDGYKQNNNTHPVYAVLNRHPHQHLTRFLLIKMLVNSVLLRGNGFAVIKRDSKGNAISLQFQRPENVYINYNEQTEKLSYRVQGYSKLIEPCNMIHLKKFSVDGINGISVLQNARYTLQLSSDAESSARGFYKNGCNLSGILSSEKVLNSAQKEQIRTAWQTAFSARNGNSNGIAVLDSTMKYEAVTINPIDAQLLEARQFNVIDICRFFGVSPTKAFDYDKVNYNSLEATQLAFLTDTLQPWLELIEEEFTRKLFKPSESNLSVNFDDSQLLRADKQALADYYYKLFQIGAISQNEVRRALNLPPVADGDNTFIQINMSTTQNVANGLNNNNKQKTNDNEDDTTGT